MGFGGKSGFNNAMGMQEAAKKAAEKAAKEKDFFDKSARQKADMRTADGGYDYSRTGLAGNAANSSANKAGAPSGDINQIMAGRRRSAPPVAETAPVMREELGNAIAPMNYDDPANRVYADSMGAAMAQQASPTFGDPSQRVYADSMGEAMAQQASPAQQAAQQVVQGPQAAPVEQTSSIMEAADGLRQATPAQARSNEAFNPMKLANEKKASQLPNKAGGGKFGGAAPRSNINQPFQSGKGQNKGSS